MKYVNLNTLKIEEKELSTWEIKNILFEDVQSWSEDSLLTVYSKVKETIQSFFNNNDNNNDDNKNKNNCHCPILFNVKLDITNIAADVLEQLIVIIVETILKFNICSPKPQSREREKRLGIPKNLTELNCNYVHLKNSINNKCFYDCFNIITKDNNGSLLYSLIKEQ